MIKCTPLICSKHEKYAAVITDYAAGIADKLIRRHPHVFADVVYASETEQKQAWDSKRRLNLRVLFINACSGSTCICRARFTATSNKSPISSSICPLLFQFS
jgi:hypothetical protein